MWKTSMFLAVGWVVAMGLAAYPDEKVKVKYNHGKIVRVAPDKNTVVVQTGTGTAVKEVELRVDATTKFYAVGQKPITQGLRFEGFREGAEIWYVDDNRVVTDLRFYDPVAAVDVRGKVVRVDLEKNIVVIQTGTGVNVKEVEYTIEPTTRIWGADQKVIDTGIRYTGWAPGTDVWYRVGPRGRVISEVRFYDPAIRRPRP